MFKIQLDRFIKYVFLIVVPCAVGTFYDKENKVCIPCPMGTYQSESGQLQCSACPAIAGRTGVTVGPGARSAADCKGNLHSILCYEFSSRKIT